jgi:hypothetical protein
MYKIEKVFQIPKTGGMYENIKIAVEGEDPLEIFKDIYTILYLDRLISFTINNTGDAEKALEIIEGISDMIEQVKFKLNGEE